LWKLLIHFVQSFAPNTLCLPISATLRQTRVGCPQQNGYAECFVSAIKRECIDQMIFFSEKSLRRAVGQYIEHFHQELDNLIPFPNIPQKHLESGPIVKSERRAVHQRVRLGGLLNYYYREEMEVKEVA